MTDFRVITHADDKHIEDVIDARKKVGQYDVFRSPKVTQSLYTKKSYYDPMTALIDENSSLVNDLPMWLNEENLANYSSDSGLPSIGPTDSEITVVRVKRESLRYKTNENKWNLNDDAVPGDGTHLGESPSMINLATLVGQSLYITENKKNEYNEYLVPLSSWDPSDYPRPLSDNTSSTAAHGEEPNKKSLKNIFKHPNNSIDKRGITMGKVSKTLRKRDTKSVNSTICNFDSINQSDNCSLP